MSSNSISVSKRSSQQIFKLTWQDALVNNYTLLYGYLQNHPLATALLSSYCPYYPNETLSDNIPGGNTVNATTNATLDLLIPQRFLYPFGSPLGLLLNENGNIPS